MNFQRRAVQGTREYQRVRDLPRRQPVLSEDDVRQISSRLQTQDGTMDLRPVQALALHDLGDTGGLSGPIRVGGGKTLISLLAPNVLGLRRPLLLLPASLVAKTEAERAVLMRHWQIPRNIRIQSYEGLGRAACANFLNLYNPDGIIADEAHRLKNRRAACTRRVVRFMKEHPDTKFIAMSGTFMKHSLRDFGHLMAWSLGEGAPIPLEEGELDEWADALDEKVNPLTRIKPGVLGADLTSARKWFQGRLVETPGVVTTQGDGVVCSLYVRAMDYDVNTATEANFAKLRGEWCTPDGWALAQAVDVWRHARELALGLHYIWFDDRRFRECLTKIQNKGRLPIANGVCKRVTEFLRQIMNESVEDRKDSVRSVGSEVTRSEGSRLITTIEQGKYEDFFAGLVTCPSHVSETLLKVCPELSDIFEELRRASRPPDAWLDARKAWAKFARDTIKNSDHLDSELMVVNACDRGDLDDELLLAWRAVKDSFEKHSKPVWHDDGALVACERWMNENPGIVWCEHIFFAEELSRRTGAPYFAAGGLDRQGNAIERENGRRPVIASVASCGTGRNLQMFSRNLITSCPTGADQAEQLLGRTHRDGQESDEVTFDILLGCAEHWCAFDKARKDAQMHQDVLGQPQKLLLADCDWPRERSGSARWSKSLD